MSIKYIGSKIGFLAESFQQLLETNDLYKTLMDRARSGEDISGEIPHAVNESLSGINQVSAIIKAMRQFTALEEDLLVRVDRGMILDVRSYL